MIEAVVFDVDGVLVHSGVFGAQLEGTYGVGRALLDSFWRGPFVQCALGLSDLKQELTPLLGESGYRGSVEDFLQAWFEADSALNAEVFDDVRRLRSRGIPCHVASNQERHRASYLEGPMGLANHFDKLFFSCALGVKKPELEFFRQVTHKLGVSPGNLLFFDDQQANVEAARAAGWNAEVYVLGSDLPSLLASYGVVV